MVFSSSVFLFGFLPLLLILYFIIPNNKYRNYLLLVFSLIFYAWAGPKYIILMVTLVMADYIFAYAIHLSKSNNYKKLFMALAVVSNLGVLGYYKYNNFFVENLNALFRTNIAISKIMLPIGISFFTFQAMSYVIDVYRGDTKVQRNPFYVLLYVALFPQLIAGPIVRYKTIEDEIINRKVKIEDFSIGLERFIIGFAKKVIVSNNIGGLADAIFGTAVIDAPLAWLGVFAYTLQIYFDFSAYSDMAIGLGRIFGFHFDENFNFPYISKSITEFWRRWHISLSTWFRDYIYIPLGGNRKGMRRQIINIFIVWMCTGIWHGAEWNFILWGLYYFVLLMIEKLFLLKFLDKIPKILRHIYALLAIMFGWVLFRCDSGELSQCVTYVKRMLRFRFTDAGVEQAIIYLHQYGLYLVIGVIFSLPIYSWLKNKIAKRSTGKTKVALAGAGYILLLALFFVSVSYLVNSTFSPFIYFRF